MKAREGSITVYLCLMMVLMLSLLSAAFYSVKAEAGRARCAVAMDLALFSCLARYDRDLFEEFDVFFVDGGCETAAFRPDKIGSRFEEDFSANLTPAAGFRGVFGRDLLSLRLKSRGMTGYTLATDAEGDVFAAQAVRFMKDTLGVAAAAALAGTAAGAMGAAEEKGGQSAGEVSYDALLAESEEAKRRNAEEKAGSLLPAKTEAEERADAVPADFVNPLPYIERLRELTLLDLVAGGEENISGKATELMNNYESRDKESGTGVIVLPDRIDSLADKALFSQYLLGHFGYFGKEKEHAALAYESEYLLAGKGSDRENLDKVVKRLLLIREAANTASILADSEKQAEITAASASIAALLMLPAAEPVVRLLLSAGWAFVESLVDVRALLAGKKVPAVKTAETWQVSLASIPMLLSPGGMDALAGDAAGGLSYVDYLRGFFLAANRTRIVGRSLAAAEARLVTGGRENFRMDHMLGAVTFEVQVTGERRHSFYEERTLSYDDL